MREIGCFEVSYVFRSIFDIRGRSHITSHIYQYFTCCTEYIVWPDRDSWRSWQFRFYFLPLYGEKKQVSKQRNPTPKRSTMYYKTAKKNHTSKSKCKKRHEQFTSGSCNAASSLRRVVSSRQGSFNSTERHTRFTSPVAEHRPVI